MAELATMARPYARAAFNYASGGSVLQEWSESLALLSAVAQDDTMKKLCSSPSLTAEQQAEAIISVCGDKLDGNVQNLVKLLAENSRLSLLPLVATMFDEFKANKEKTVEVDIASAFDLDDQIEQRLAERLAKRLDRSVSIKTTVDKSLLGGVVIRAGDLVIDGSVRGKLAKLAEAINI